MCEITQNPLFWLHRVDKLGVHYMAFWGKANITGLSLLLGGLLRPWGSLLIFIRCIRSLVFRGSEGTLTEGYDLIRARYWKTSQNFVTSPMCVLCLESCWAGSCREHCCPAQPRLLLPWHHAIIFIYCGEKNLVLVRSPGLFIFNRLVVISFFFLFWFFFPFVFTPKPETLWIRAAE